MKIRKELIGAKHGSVVGMLTIEEGKELLYKKLGLDIFEDEVKKGSNNRKRSDKSRGENDDK